MKFKINDPLFTTVVILHIIMFIIITLYMITLINKYIKVENHDTSNYSIYKRRLA